MLIAADGACHYDSGDAITAPTNDEFVADNFGNAGENLVLCKGDNDAEPTAEDDDCATFCSDKGTIVDYAKGSLEEG